MRFRSSLLKWAYSTVPRIRCPRKNDSQPAMFALEPYCEEASSDFVVKANALQRTWWFPS